MTDTRSWSNLPDDLVYGLLYVYILRHIVPQKQCKTIQASITIHTFSRRFNREQNMIV